MPAFQGSFAGATAIHIRRFFSTIPAPLNAAARSQKTAPPNPQKAASSRRRFPQSRHIGTKLDGASRIRNPCDHVGEAPQMRSAQQASLVPRAALTFGHIRQMNSPAKSHRSLTPYAAPQLDLPSQPALPEYMRRAARSRTAAPLRPPASSRRACSRRRDTRARTAP